jgi:hypothetical protein
MKLKAGGTSPPPRCARQASSHSRYGSFLSHAGAKILDVSNGVCAAVPSPEKKRPGEVAEWSNAPDSKSGVPQGTGGSNPSLSANFQSEIASRSNLPAPSFNT